VGRAPDYRGRVRAFLVGVILFAALPARAGEKVALASFRTLGEHMTEPARGALRLSLTGGLAAAGFEVVPDDEQTLKLKTVPGLAGCETATCLKRLGEVLGVKDALKAQIEMIGSSRYLTSLALIETETGRELARVDDTCEVCTLSEANDAVSNAAAALKAKLEPPRVAPPPQPVVAAAVTDQPPPKPGKLTLALRYGGIALLGVGVVGLIVGFSELGIDGSRTCTVPPGFLDCPGRVSTKDGQIFGFVTGGIGIAVGTVATIIGWKRRW
jgi:hypothetical protein